MINHTDLLALVVCPSCRNALKSFQGCAHCGATFSEIDSTPALFAKSSARTVKFHFDQSRSTMGDRFKQCFTYPTRREGASGDYPYHLDLAHLSILEQLPPKSTVLEIGCGGGQMRSFLQSRGHRYVGMDISKTRVGKDLQKFGGPDLLGDAHFLPFAEGVFDLVYSAAVTEHLASPYLVAQEVARSLKPGGFYLGNCSFLEPWHDDSFFHMSPLGVFELLTQANFEVAHIWPGQDYSGFQAIMGMGNKVTRSLSFLGDLMYFIYRASNRFRRFAKRRSEWKNRPIAEAARVSGSTDWIARRASS
jgi:SAM-dependent methyltransferase